LELEIASAHANGLMSLDLLDPVTARIAVSGAIGRTC
jgi:hypothetical protein